MYSLGIGKGFSEQLVEGVAEAGKGTSAAVYESAQIADAVVGLIEDCLKPGY